MKCYYEVLNIEREADNGEIKTAYRKLALKWHPDKNLANPDEAKEQFQLVQNAYEVLSDPQERAWYDNHREQLLRGVGSEFNDESLDLIPFFTASCFKGFGDDNKGFYEVYREVFKKLAAEEVDYLDDPEDVNKIPQFGKSDTAYEDVNLFYSYWLSFSTSKSFVWLDKYDIREADNRRVLKLIEKENQKIRQKARKERNDEIRELATFIRKRDKRVLAHNKLMEEKSKENKKKLEDTRKEKAMKRQQELEEEKKRLKDVGVYNMNNLNERLEEIEKHLAEEFGNSEDEYSSYESEDDAVQKSDEEKSYNDYIGSLKNLYCSACSKSFKNIKSFENHEKSKKHKENVMNLQHDSDIDVSDDEENVDEKIPADKNDTELTHSPKDSMEEDEEEEVPIVPVKSKKKKNKKSIPVPVINYSDSESENVDISELETEGRGRKARKAKNIMNAKNKSKKIETPLSPENSNIVEENDVKVTNENGQDSNNANNEVEEDNIECEINNKTGASKEKKATSKNKKVKKLSQKAKIEIACKIEPADLADIDTSHCCVVCKGNFPSKNKLFDHLKKTGHQIYLPSDTPAPSKSKKRKDVKQK